ncbi:MAG: peptide-methionine (S)-S-oxide reductase MsrA [Cellvibrionaceae bacterium]
MTLKSITTILFLLSGLWINTTIAAEKPLKTNFAIFAGGCFWCMEPPFEKLPGVISVESGYSGGSKENPDYKAVSSGSTRHLEVIQVVYNPAQVSYSKLLEVFWRNVDPTDANGQFCDKGYQYTTAIFYNSPEQQALAESSKAELFELSAFAEHPIVTPILPTKTFYRAEGYHQDYYKRNPIRYKYYRYSCGRDKRLKALWGKNNKGKDKGGSPTPITPR